MKSHKDLDVWKRSIQLVSLIYEITEDYPKKEVFGLVSQMRRCAVSIPSNIAEGAARQNDKEFRRFLFISLGSVSELETQLIISENLKYHLINDKLNQELDEIRKMILGLIRHLEKKM